jgi:PEP-CTERM motif
MRKHLTGAALLGAAAMLGPVGAARADLTVVQNDGTPFTITETGGSGPGLGIPVGTTGFIGSANLVADRPGFYTFTYFGAGDSVDLNQFTVAGNSFCSQAGLAACGGTASTPGVSQFTVKLPAGDIPFTFVASVENSGGVSLGNSDPTGDPPYPASVFTGIAGGCTATSCPEAWLGLTDLPGNGMTGDHDFQDLTVLVKEVPEPASMALLGSGLVSLAFAYRRKARKLDRKS